MNMRWKSLDDDAECRFDALSDGFDSISCEWLVFSFWIFLSDRIQMNAWLFKLIFNIAGITCFISINDISRRNRKRKVIKRIYVWTWPWRQKYFHRDSWFCHKRMNFQPVKIFLPAWNTSPEAFVLIYFASSYADVPADRDRETVRGINFQWIHLMKRHGWLLCQGRARLIQGCCPGGGWTGFLKA